jgi:3-oxoacyl-[acyl-carrier-protein] synthase-3
VQAELGATRAAAFDVMAACSSFLYGLIVAEGLMHTGSAETSLVIGTEKLTTIVDWKDRSTCVLFGDGSGAAVLKCSDGTKGILSTFMRIDGRLAELLYRPSGGAAHPFDATVLQDRSFYVRMEGREVFKHAVRSMSEAADRASMARSSPARHRRHDSAPGQYCIIEATAKHADPDGQGVRQRRPLREHLLRVRPHRPEEALTSGRSRRMNVLLVAWVSPGRRWSSVSSLWTSSCCFPARDRRSRGWEGPG